MKTKILVLTAALIGAASLSANARPIYGEFIPAPAPACAPVARVFTHPDRPAPAHYTYDRHDFRRDYDHRR